MNFVGNEYQRTRDPVVEEQKLSDDEEGSGSGSESED
jgi:hypothetical protein